LLFFRNRHLPHLKVGKTPNHEIPPYWKKRKIYPIIPGNKQEAFMLIKKAIRSTGGFPLIFLWTLLNLNREDNLEKFYYFSGFIQG
jgi:hypothetical protein